MSFRQDATLEELIDVCGRPISSTQTHSFKLILKETIEGNRVYIPCVYVLNKIDAISIEELGKLVSGYPAQLS